MELTAGTDLRLWLAMLYAGTVVMELWLTHLNLGWVRRAGARVPDELAGTLTEEKLRQAADYFRAKSRLGSWAAAIEGLALLGFVFTPLLPWYTAWIDQFPKPFFLSGVFFFWPLLWAQALIQAPFDWFRVFRVEQRFGFNTMTGALWCSDWLKQWVLASVVAGLLLAGGFGLLQLAPNSWWFWAWLLVLGVSVLLTYLSPVLIEPLFNTFKPLADPELNEAIRALFARVGIRVERVTAMDASKRSRHSNAYFTGIGRVKRIVLYDTLLAQMNRGEVLAVLAHEAGHWKRRHVLKRLALQQAILLAAAYAAFLLLNGHGFARIFHLPDTAVPAQLLAMLVSAAMPGFLLKPALMAWSRKHEAEADRFAVSLVGQGADLAGALRKLTLENLSIVHPHPAYVWWHYSHPPILRRLRALLKTG